MIEFFVAGDPKTAGSKRGFAVKDKRRPGRHRVILTDDAGEAGVNWRTDVRAAAQRALPEGHKLMDGPIELKVRFLTRRPKGHYGTGRNAEKLKPNAPMYPATWKDLTKMLRALEDALNGVVWTDDRRIVSQLVCKCYHDNPGALVMISDLQIAE